jgi:single-strand DNA-binding protein
MALNKAMVIGHLGQKPELRYIPTNGAAVTSFSVATNDVFLDKQGQKQERVDWHNIVVFGKLAETCAVSGQGSRSLCRRALEDASVGAQRWRV